MNAPDNCVGDKQDYEIGGEYQYRDQEWEDSKMQVLLETPVEHFIKKIDKHPREECHNEESIPITIHKNCRQNIQKENQCESPEWELPMANRSQN